MTRPAEALMQSELRLMMAIRQIRENLMGIYCWEFAWEVIGGWKLAEIFSSFKSSGDFTSWEVDEIF